MYVSIFPFGSYPIGFFPLELPHGNFPFHFPLEFSSWHVRIGRFSLKNSPNRISPTGFVPLEFPHRKSSIGFVPLGFSHWRSPTGIIPLDILLRYCFLCCLRKPRQSMYTLFKVMTTESWADIARHAGKVSPGAEVFFVFYIFCTSHPAVTIQSWPCQPCMWRCIVFLFGVQPQVAVGPKHRWPLSVE